MIQFVLSQSKDSATNRNPKNTEVFSSMADFKDMFRSTINSLTETVIIHDVVEEDLPFLKDIIQQDTFKIRRPYSTKVIQIPMPDFVIQSATITVGMIEKYFPKYY